MYKTEQEEFWAGNFGDEYVGRNRSQTLLSSNIALFGKILSRTEGIRSLLELGCNVGMNLKAIHHLLTGCELFGVEINEQAAKTARDWGKAEIHHGSILDIRLPRAYDLTLSKGVLIHVKPEFLPAVYERLYQFSNRYICIAEYYNPQPVTLRYRGQDDRLFKRDFAGELLDAYPDLTLVDYGFAYHRDNNFPQDDITWFLLQKNGKPTS